MDIIRKMKNILQIKKIGHAGTLDPLASGLLIVCTGKMTKKINVFMDLPKQYTAHINLTAFSETDDAEGPLTKIIINQQPSLEQIKHVIQSFIGTIQQTPPKFSAIKINGKRAYKKARKGEQFDMPIRTITIHNINIISYNWPTLIIDVHCSKGTYIRSLARDIGKELHTGGYLTTLVRTAIGPHTLNDAITLEKLKDNSKSFELKASTLEQI